jgi:hypothetical protein
MGRLGSIMKGKKFFKDCACFGFFTLALIALGSGCLSPRKIPPPPVSFSQYKRVSFSDWRSCFLGKDNLEDLLNIWYKAGGHIDFRDEDGLVFNAVSIGATRDSSPYSHQYVVVEGVFHGFVRDSNGVQPNKSDIRFDVLPREAQKAGWDVYHRPRVACRAPFAMRDVMSTFADDDPVRVYGLVSALTAQDKSDKSHLWQFIFVTKIEKLE